MDEVDKVGLKKFYDTHPGEDFKIRQDIICLTVIEAKDGEEFVITMTKTAKPYHFKAIDEVTLTYTFKIEPEANIEGKL